MTEAFVLAAAGNLLANVLSDAFAEVYRQYRNDAPQLTYEIDLNAVKEMMNDALRNFNPADLVPEGEPSDIDAMTAFLLSRDVDNFAADVVAMYILDLPIERSPDLVRQCREILVAYGMDSVRSQESSVELLRFLSETCNRCLTKMPPPASFSTTDTRRQYEEQFAAYRRLQQRQRERMSHQLATIINLVDRDHVDMRQIEDNLKKLRTAVARVHSTITPPSLDAVERVPIDEIYVAPNLTVTLETRGIGHRKMPNGKLERVIETRRTSREYTLPTMLSSLLRNSLRTVVLGNPGAGKTTFGSYIAKTICDVNRRGSKKLPKKDSGKVEAAIPVVLREHSAATTLTSGIDLIEATRVTALHRYQVSLTRSEITFLCSSGRLLLIIDGLDELVDLQDRVAVTASLEAFSAVHDRCPILVTSRIVGYSQAPLDKSLFNASLIPPFNPQQVATYVKKWFALHEESTRYQREGLVSAFLRESAPVDDVRENPLMLSLMCSLYRYQRYIPRNRPQVYASCSRLLFDQWDRKRKLRPKFEFDAHVDGAVQFLAHWMFTQQSRQSGVPEPDLVDVAAKYFNEWQYANDAEARRAAAEFIDFCKGRAWILTDTGSNRSGVALFQFTHRTFLEYFAAVYLARALSEESLGMMLIERSKIASWNVVCQILVQLAPAKRQGLEDRLIKAIIEAFPSMSPDEKALSLGVCVDALNSVPLRPETARAVASKSFTQYWARLAKTPVQVAAIEGRDPYWLSASRIAIENYRAVGDVVLSGITISASNPAYSKSSGFLKRTAHLFDFFFVEGANPAWLSDALSSCRDGALSIAEIPAWLRGVAFLAGFGPILGEDSRQDLLGKDFPRKLSPLKTPWGNQSVPNIFEIFVWYLSYGEATDEDYVRMVLSPWVRAGLKEVAKARNEYEEEPKPKRTRRHSQAPHQLTKPLLFEPHKSWYFESREGSEGLFHGGPAAVGPYANETLRLAILVACLLVDLHLRTQSEEDLEESIRELQVKDWGHLSLMQSAIALRFDISEWDSSGDEEWLRELGLLEWCGGSITAEQLITTLGYATE